MNLLYHRARKKRSTCNVQFWMVPATGGGTRPGIFGKGARAFSQAALAQGAHFPYNTKCGMRTDA